MDAPASGASIICPRCGIAVETPYCGYCGRLLRDDAGVPFDPGAFVREGAVEALGLDNRIARTARDTLIRPAEVIRAHLKGRGASYVHPLKFFLLLAGVYMVVLTWLTPFSFFAIADAPDTYGVNLMKVVLGADNATELRLLFESRGLTEETANARFEGRMNTLTPLVSALSLVPLALILGLLWTHRPWKEHALFVLVTWNAIWLVSILVAPLWLANSTLGVLADYAATYGIIGMVFFTYYGRRPLVPASGKFLAFIAAEVLVSSLVSALMTAAILATIFIP